MTEFFLRLEPVRGCGINDLVRAAARFAGDGNIGIKFTFEGVEVEVWPTDRIGDVVTGYRQAIAAKESEVSDGDN